MPAGARVHRMCAGVRLLACLVLAGGAACKVATPAAVARPDTLRFTAALFALALGALAAVAVVSLRSSSAHTVELFTLNDFDTGRVSFPSQNLANGQGIQAPVAPGGPDHSHVMWSNGFRPFNGGQKLFSIHDFDSGRVSFPEEATRGLRAVVKSTDTNIDPAGTGSDHVWQHQMSHGPVEYQDWPLEMPGVGDGLTAAAPSPAFKAPTMQLRALPEGKSQVGKKQMALSNKLDKMQRQVRTLPAPCSCEPCRDVCSFVTCVGRWSALDSVNAPAKTARTIRLMLLVCAHEQTAGGAVTGQGGERASAGSYANAEQQRATSRGRAGWQACSLDSPVGACSGAGGKELGIRVCYGAFFWRWGFAWRSVGTACMWRCVCMCVCVCAGCENAKAASRVCSRQQFAEAHVNLLIRAGRTRVHRRVCTTPHSVSL
jgi:hypothetical protein